MIHMKANTRRAVALSDDLITTGSVGIEVEILCSEAWNGLTKTVLFRGSGSSVDVILTGDSCTVPPEVLTRSGGQLLIGLYGTDGSGSLAIPTVWADAGRILQGAAPSGIAPTPAQQSALDQAIAALNAATEEIPEQIDTALAEAKASGEFDGEPGDDGFSPEVSVATITGGNRVTITDAQGAHTFDVMDGEDGDDNIFWATYNTTTEAEVTAAVTAGKTVLCKISDEIFYLVSKAAIGPSGSAWIFASANQTSMRVTWVSGSYWNSIGTRMIPIKTSDLTNDSGFVNASDAAAAAPVQSVNGQTGAVTVPAIPSGGSDLQYLTLFTPPFGTQALGWMDLPQEVTFVDFVLDANETLDSAPTWIEVETAQGNSTVIARLTNADGDIKFLPLTHFNSARPGAIFSAKFAATDADGVLRTIESGDTLNSWIVDERDVGGQIDELQSGMVWNDWGIGDAGKFLVVGSDGIVTTMSLATWQGGNY